MNRSNFPTRLILSLGAICAAGGAGSTMAQGLDVLEEITVTARKRSESFQEVPVAVNVFTDETVEKAGIETPHDFIALTPNVNVVQTQNAGNSFIVVRGISQARNSEPSVAVLLDGVPMANPAQFNQELFDIQQIEVLKGPQGALYGRNAIGGAITITTKEPSNEFEGQIRAGVEEEGYKLQGSVNIPFSDIFAVRGSFNYKDIDGYIDNTFLNKPADPYKDMSYRLRFSLFPTESFGADLRIYQSNLETQGFWFNIAPDVNDNSLDVRVNNAGINERDLFNTSLKLDWETGNGGTFTSITSYDTVEEITTGDQWDFLPIPDAILTFFTGFDQVQTQYFDIESTSQEFRYTSPGDQSVRWIVGAYAIATDRFVSTTNIIDNGDGSVPKVHRTPLSGPWDFVSTPLDPQQVTFLADSQDNFAWAVFGDLSVDISDQMEASFSLRYDKDERENTTETPDIFFAFTPLAGSSFQGEVRKETWDEWQPKVSLRYSPADNVSLYGIISRGFRSGGFNQAGVEAAGVTGVTDIFDREIADTIEFGYKGQYLDNRLTTSFNIFKTFAEGSYYFVFDPGTSTQNLGSLDEVEYQGFEFEINALVAENLSLNAGLGYTDSEITKDDDIPAAEGNQAPLVSEFTLNLGLDYRQPLSDALEGFVRADYQYIGETYWEPFNTPNAIRDPISLLNLRFGVEAVENWTLTVWVENALDEEYNTEWSPDPFGNGFVYKGMPRRFGVDFLKRF